MNTLLKSNFSSQIITPEQLNQKISQKNQNIKILDFRDLAFYQLRHLDSALPASENFSDLQQFRQTYKQQGILEAIELYQPILKSMDINNEDELILYDSVEEINFEAQLFFFAMDVIGLENLSLVQGGIEAMEQNQYLKFKDHDYVAPLFENKGNFEIKTGFKKSINLERYINYVNLHPIVLLKERDPQKVENIKIIDVRIPQEVQRGKIDHSINIPLQKFMNVNENRQLIMKNDKEIEEILNENGVQKTDEIIVYCQKGFRSSYLYAYLKGYGYNNVRNYFGSYEEWHEKSNQN